MKQCRFIHNALLLTVGTMVLRCVGTVFMIYLSNRIGAEGIGLYQLVSSVYMLAVTLSTSGISLAVTRIVSEELALDRPATARGAFRRCLALSVLLGLAAGGLLYLNAKNLGVFVLRDERTVLSFRLLAIGLPFLSVGSVVRGYFLGLQKPMKSVAGDAVEQFSMMLVTVPALTLLLPKGLEYACCGLVLGSVVSEALSCLFSIALYQTERIKAKGGAAPGTGRRVLSIAAPIAVSNYFRSFLTTIENILVPPGLKKYGASNGQALSQYGMIKGMAMPVLTLPAAILSAFASLLIPEVSRAKALGAVGRINYIINKCFKATLLFAMLTVGIFLCFSQEVGEALYGNAQVGEMLLLLAPLVPFLYLDQIVDSILKGLNQQFYTMKLNTVDSLMRVLLIYILVPMLGIRGYLIMLYAGTIFNATFSIGRLILVGKVRFRIVDWLIKPTLCVAAACLLTRLLPGLPVLADALVVALLYLLFLRVAGCVTLRDIRWIRRVFSAKAPPGNLPRKKPI